MVEAKKSETIAAPRLRVAQVVVNLVLVWDDGSELSPGPVPDPQVVIPSQLAEYAAGLGEQVRVLEGQILASQATAEQP